MNDEQRLAEIIRVLNQLISEVKDIKARATAAEQQIQRLNA